MRLDIYSKTLHTHSHAQDTHTDKKGEQQSIEENQGCGTKSTNLSPLWCINIGIVCKHYAKNLLLSFSFWFSLFRF